MNHESNVAQQQQQQQQQYCLKWNNHRSTILSVFDSLLEEESLVDVTLGAEGQFLQAHRVILSACSPYFRSLFRSAVLTDKHPVVFMKDVDFENLKALVEYMYKGEANVAQIMLPSFIRTAESLQIRGLAEGASRTFDSTPHDSNTLRTSTPKTLSESCKSSKTPSALGGILAARLAKMSGAAESFFPDFSSDSPSSSLLPKKRKSETPLLSNTSTTTTTTSSKRGHKTSKSSLHQPHTHHHYSSSHSGVGLAPPPPSSHTNSSSSTTSSSSNSTTATNNNNNNTTTTNNNNNNNNNINFGDEEGPLKIDEDVGKENRVEARDNEDEDEDSIVDLDANGMDSGDEEEEEEQEEPLSLHGPPTGGIINPWTGEDLSAVITEDPSSTDLMLSRRGETGLVGWPGMLGDYTETLGFATPRLATPPIRTATSPRLKRFTNNDSVFTMCQTSDGPKFRCTACSRVFNLKCTLLRHVRHQHQGRFVPHPCSQCGQVFKRTDHLKVHMKKIHNITAVSKTRKNEGIVDSLLCSPHSAEESPRDLSNSPKSH